MTKEQFDTLNSFNNITNKIITGKDLYPFLKDRTLLYGYTCERECFHVYMKDMEIHTVLYNSSYSNGVEIVTNMREIEVTSNIDYLPDKRVYPELSDFHFCRLLKNKGIDIPFTSWNREVEKEDFYGFTLDSFEKSLSDSNVSPSPSI